jgi:hypothetical protein
MACNASLGVLFIAYSLGYMNVTVDIDIGEFVLSNPEEEELQNHRVINGICYGLG